MATTFSITNSVNIDDASLAGRTGGDIYNINGATLTIDQDHRYGVNGGATYSHGNITINTSLGGRLFVDGRAIRVIPFDSGTGNVPAYNTIVTQSGQTGSGKMIAVYANLTSAAVAPGSAMPTSGYIKLKQVTGSYATGALSGIGATATGPDVVGWLELVGNEGSSTTAKRLGKIDMWGEWYQLGVSTGLINQTYQIPNHGTLRHMAGVFVEQTVGGEDYEFWPAMGASTEAVGTEPERGKICYISDTGLVRIGNNGTVDTAYVPPSGLRIVVPNIFLENCTTADRSANVRPNSSITARHTWVSQVRGNIELIKVNSAWYNNFNTPYLVKIQHCGFNDHLIITDHDQPYNIADSGTGPSAGTLQEGSPINITRGAGGSIVNYIAARQRYYAYNSPVSYFNDLNGVTITNFTTRSQMARTTVLPAIYVQRCVGCTFNNPNIMQGSMQLVSSNNNTINNPRYIDALTGTTGTSNAIYAIHFISGSSNNIVNGFVLPLTNNQPYNGPVIFTDAGTGNKIRTIGTRSNPLDMGTVNASAYGINCNISGGGKVQRVYMKNLRSGLFVQGQSSNNWTVENCGNNYGAIYQHASINSRIKGALASVLFNNSATGMSGSHFVDIFTSATVGAIGFMLNAPSPSTDYLVTLTDGAAFTAANTIYMPTIGMSVTIEMDYFALGHTGFSSISVNSSISSTTWQYDYQIDKNDGNGYSVWREATTTNLTAETGIDPSKGIKLKLRITTLSANTGTVQNVVFNTTSTAEAQDYQYPLDVSMLQINNMVSGSIVKVQKVSDNSVLYTGSANQIAVEYEGDVLVTIRKGTGSPAYLEWQTQTTLVSESTTTITALQQPDQ